MVSFGPLGVNKALSTQTSKPNAEMQTMTSSAMKYQLFSVMSDLA